VVANSPRLHSDRRDQSQPDRGTGRVRSAFALLKRPADLAEPLMLVSYSVVKGSGVPAQAFKHPIGAHGNETSTKEEHTSNGDPRHEAAAAKVDDETWLLRLIANR
jgi:hypothetical protein